MAWAPTPSKVPEEERRLEKVGNHLSNVTSELIGSSFCPRYSKKQLRKINRIRKEKANIGNRKSMAFKRNKSTNSQTKSDD